MRKPRILSLEESSAALESAESTVARWSDEAAEKARAAEVLAAELAEAHSRAADDLLDDDDPDVLSRIAADLERRQSEQGLAVQAAERAAERLTEVRRDVLRARAAATRTRAAGLDATVASRQAHTEQILAALADFEKVRFAVAERNNSGIGAPIRPYMLTQQIANRAKSLSGHADQLDLVAGTGAPDEVLAMANKPLPEVLGIETAAIPVPAV